MSSGWQHFELTAVLGSEMTGWECAGCGAHLSCEDRNGRTLGTVKHESGCTELTIMLGQPAPGETRSGMARLRALESQMTELAARVGDLKNTAAGTAGALAARADGQDAALGHLDEALKGLGSVVSGLDARITGSARRGDMIDDRLAVVEQHLTPHLNEADQIRADLARLEIAVGGLIEHGGPGHSLPNGPGGSGGAYVWRGGTGGQGRPASVERAAAAAGQPVQPASTRNDWVLRVTAGEDWTDQHLRAAIGDLPGIEVHQVSFTGSLITAGGGQGTADAAGEPGYVRVSGGSSNAVPGGGPGGGGRVQ